MERPFPLTRGAVHLARLDPAKGAEVGECRPVVLLTAQYLLDVDPSVLFICPLSSRKLVEIERALAVFLGIAK